MTFFAILISLLAFGLAAYSTILLHQIVENTRSLRRCGAIRELITSSTSVAQLESLKEELDEYVASAPMEHSYMVSCLVKYYDAALEHKKALECLPS